MIPRGAQGVAHLVTRIAQDLIPKASDAYMATDLGYFTALLGMIGQDYDRAADVLVSEHAALIPILRAAADRLGDADLKARTDAAVAMQPVSLRVSDLAARSDVTMTLLIDVHAAVEAAQARGAHWADALNDEIWRFLETHVAAQAYDVGF
jgi:hypothetical protein